MTRSLVLLVFLSGCQLLARLDQPLPDGDAGTDADTSKPSAYEAAVLGDGPILYYRFDEASGVLCKDKSGHGNDGSVGGAFTREPSAVGDANDFSLHFGPAGQLPLDAKFDFALRSSYTMELWIKLEKYGQIFGNLRDMGGTRVGIAAYARDASAMPDMPSIGFERWAGNITEFAHDFAAVLATDRFMHWVVISDKGVPKLVIDGRVVPGYTKPNPAPYQPGTILIDVAGSIDELAIYDRALADDRVLAHYQVGKR